MQGRVGTAGFVADAAQVPTPATFEHALLAARAQVLSNPAVDALRAWPALVAAPGFLAQPAQKQAAGRYGAALAAAKLRDFAGAALHLATLSELTRGQTGAGRQYRLLSAEIALAQGEPAKAAVHLSTNEAVLKALDAKNPVSGRPEILLGAATALALAKPADALELLQAWLADHPRDASAWLLRASAHAQAGQTLRAIRADGEARAAQFDYAAALDRFKAGQEAARQLARDAARTGQPVDHVEASILDTRARAVGLLLREQALER
jgi:predicted Zn-dependent protease